MSTGMNNFKCRCSAINKMMANSRSNPILTENQVKELAELENRKELTVKQAEKLGELRTK